jgi:hypothetical protein
MSDSAHAVFPPEEVCARTQGNAAAWILTMIAYPKERGSAVEDCAAQNQKWCSSRPISTFTNAAPSGGSAGYPCGPRRVG